MYFIVFFFFYANRLRLFGEEAAAQVSESTVSMINLLATMTGDTERNQEESKENLLNTVINSYNLSTIFLCSFLDDKISEFEQRAVLSHSKTLIKSVTHDSAKRLALTFEDKSNGNVSSVCVARLFAMYISYLQKRVGSVLGTSTFQLVFALPPFFSEATKQCYIDACLIAGIAKSTVTVVDSSDCLVATYSR